MLEIISSVYFYPLVALILMSVSVSLLGVILYIQKKSLLAETISHASFPGVIITLFFVSIFGELYETKFSLYVVIGSVLFAYLAIYLVSFLQKRFRFSSDSSLTFVLAAFLGLGILLMEPLHNLNSSYYWKIQGLLFGEAALLNQTDCLTYLIFTVVVISLFILFYRLIEALFFDRQQAMLLGLPVKVIQVVMNGLLVLTIAFAIQSIGVILILGMLVAPAIAARQYTQKLSSMAIVSVIIGLIATVVGFVLSMVSVSEGSRGVFLPTGPTIVVIAFVLALFALFFSSRGFVAKIVRVFMFRFSCSLENLLKGLVKEGAPSFTIVDMRRLFCFMSPLQLFVSTVYLRLSGHLRKENESFVLTKKGEQKGNKILRFHRLWEVYVYKYVKVPKEMVHVSAEYLEHFFTDELVEKIESCLGDEKTCPHLREIPTLGEN